MYEGQAPEELIVEAEEQERSLVWDRFDERDGIDLGLRLLEVATERSLPVVIDVSKGGSSVFRVALPGSVPDSHHWVERKAGAVRRFGESSYLVRLRHEARGEVFEDRPDVDHARIAGHGGSVPIVVRGVGIVGTATVSGLSQQEDHLMVVQAIALQIGATD